MLFSLRNRNALVTGGSRGIGASIAKVLAEQGANVAITYHASKTQAQQVVETIQDTGQKGLGIQADLGKLSDIQKMVEVVKSQLDHVDILVNNAGMYLGKPTIDFSPEDIDRLISVNLTGPIYCIQGILPLMIQKKWGRIINISSVCAFIGCSDCAASLEATFYSLLFVERF